MAASIYDKGSRVSEKEAYEIARLIQSISTHISIVEIYNGLCLLTLRDLHKSVFRNVRQFVFLGRTENENIPHHLRGSYLTHSGNTIFCLDGSSQDLQFILSRCGSHLISIEISDSESTALAFDTMHSLETLFLRDNHSLESIRGLSACTELTTFSISNCEKLAKLDLSGCMCLKELLGFENLTGLTTLNLENCYSLSQLPSFDHLSNLTYLNCSKCTRLTQLPNLDHQVLLACLNLNECSSLIRLPNLDNLTSLTMLSLQECTSLMSIPSLDYLTQLTEFVLRKCSTLTQLPNLDVLSHTTSLNFSECSSLVQLPSLDKMEQLTRLDLGGCSSLTKLPNLDHLTELVHLNLTRCSSITQIPNLDKLTKLTGLYCGGCSSLTSLPSLDQLKQLTTLYIWGCSSLSQIPSLDTLTLLADLDLSGCSFLTRLPNSIRKMKNLKKLFLCDLTLAELPDWFPEIAEKFSVAQFDFGRGIQKANINLHGTTVEGVDMSIFEQPYEMVVEWFEKRKQGQTHPLNEIKVVFLGDGEAGKSHTIARLMNDGGDPIDYTDKSTPGIVIKHRDYEVEDRKFRVHYWDFGGQEIMHSMHRIFLTNRTMYVVLLNARDDTQGDKAYYWLQNIQSFAPNAPVLLVLNKIDQNPKASVDERTLRAKYPGLTEIVRMSALEFDQEQFNHEFTDVLLKEICKCDCLDAQWPKTWITVKNRLENMDTHYILGTEYKRICRECQVGEVETELLHWFNDLGVSFCFCDKEDYALKKHVILRPDWITNGLYIILFNDCAGAQNGLIPHESIYELLERASHDKSIHCTLPDASYNQPGDVEYVLGVMRKFQLSLDAGDRREFVPMLCQRESTMDIHYLEKDADTLEFRMEFEYLPDNLLHRLMVERHNELDMTNVWRTGARFELPGTGISAVVVIESETLKFFIRHTGTMHRPNTYLTMLKANTDRIWRRMGLQEPTYQLVYKLDNKTGVFDYEELQQAHEDGESTVYSKVWRKRISIEDILNQSAPEALEDERRLLENILTACQHLQGESDYQISTDAERNKGLEDKRNRRVRDDLEIWGYTVKDQPQYGRSGTGKSIGELDILVYDEQKRPWTVIEALRLSKYETGDWNHHLDKLLYNYNYFGAHSQYLLTYVDCRKEEFGGIWTAFKAHIQGQSGGGFPYVEGSFVDLNDPRDPLFVKKSLCRYNCGGQEITVYHIFAQIDLP